MKLDHYSSKFSAKQFPITLICDNVTNAPNIGSLFRIADAFGVEKLILCGDHVPLGRKMKKTSRATENAVNYEVKPNALEVVKGFDNETHQIIAVEITSNSEPLHQYKFNIKMPLILIVGDEVFGVSDAILEHCDAVVHINMFGQNSSMNVVQATNLVLYEITKQLL